MNYMFLPLRRYFDFRGRSRRMEFWMWTLFVFLATVVFSMLDAALGLGGSADVDTINDPSAMNYSAAGALSGGILANLFMLATFIPGIAVSVRRLHDLDRTGWWVLAPLLPYVVGLLLLASSFFGGAPGGGVMIGAFVIIGAGLILALVLLVWYFMPGTTGPNRFGPDPKDPHGGEEAAEIFG